MKHIFLVLFLSFGLLLAGCTSFPVPQEEPEVVPASGELVPLQDLEPTPVDMTNKEQVAEYALQAFKNLNIQDLEAVASSQGIRFSPYSYVDTGRHITLKKEELQLAFSGATEYVWGSEDGTGDPILMTFKRYLKRYVYDVDFDNLATVSFGESPQRGNIINNVVDIYSGSLIVEYYLSGINPEYEGMDRKGLTFVFDQEETLWKLNAVIHHEWTI